MRHGKKFNHLSRTDSHRRALLSSLATSLIVHKRITTTVAKAKALRVYVEPLLTKSKTDSTHSRRSVFSYLQDKNSVNILFRDISSKIAERSGGYTRIIKTGTRLGDNAEMCFIELVDYNSLYSAKTEIKKAKTTRRGRSSGTTTTTKLNLEPKSGKELEPKIEKEGKDKLETKTSSKLESTAETTSEIVTKHSPVEATEEKNPGTIISENSASEEKPKDIASE